MTEHGFHDKRLSEVSIHTPTQGVTITSCKATINPMFQSTHPRRVWLPKLNGKKYWLCFNPHTHAGCDNQALYIIRNELFQSTHPRRVWQSLKTIDYGQESFNPHTHAGCDSNTARVNPNLSLFQSTHPRRVWLRYNELRPKLNGFNPHTHAGCDFVSTLFPVDSWSFNPHTHAGCDSISNNIL